MLIEPQRLLCNFTLGVSGYIWPEQPLVNMALCAIVITKLRYQYRVALKFINDKVLVINAPRPIAG